MYCHANFLSCHLPILLDFAMKSLIGLYTSSSLEEILFETTDKQVARLAAQSIARHTSFPKTQTYVWELPAGTELPDNVHLSRDKPCEENMDVPSGHFTRVISLSNGHLQESIEGIVFELFQLDLESMPIQI